MKIQTPELLDRVVDKVFSYQPKPKTKAAKKRERREKYAAKKGR